MLRSSSGWKMTKFIRFPVTWTHLKRGDRTLIWKSSYFEARTRGGDSADFNLCENSGSSLFLVRKISEYRSPCHVEKRPRHGTQRVEDSAICHWFTHVFPPKQKTRFSTEKKETMTAMRAATWSHLQWGSARTWPAVTSQSCELDKHHENIHMCICIWIIWLVLVNYIYLCILGIILYYITLHYIISYYIISYYITLYYIVLHYIVLYCIILYYIVL